MVALVGLCRDGGDHAWMVSDLDRPNRHGLGTSESYGNSLCRAAGSCEPGRGLSRVPTDYERVLPMVSSGLAVNAEQSYYRDFALVDLDDNWLRNRGSRDRDTLSIVWISHPASHPFDHRTIADLMSRYFDLPS